MVNRASYQRTEGVLQVEELRAARAEVARSRTVALRYEKEVRLLRQALEALTPVEADGTPGRLARAFAEAGQRFSDDVLAPVKDLRTEGVR